MDDVVVRVDRWLHAVRVYKTRVAATQACRAGHVRVNGSPAKPASPVRRGDEVVTRGPGPVRVLEVVRPVSARVGAPLAATCVLDRSPSPVDDGRPDSRVGQAPGRPTKRDRRRLDRFRGA